MRSCTEPIDDMGNPPLAWVGAKISTATHAAPAHALRARSPPRDWLLAMHRWLGRALGLRRGRPRFHRHQRLARAVETRLVGLERPALPLARERRAHLRLHPLPRVARLI